MGGQATILKTGIIYINASEMPWVLTMVDVKTNLQQKKITCRQAKDCTAAPAQGATAPKRKGGGNYPALTDVNKKYNEEQFTALVSAGRRMMPSFNQLSASEKKALASLFLILNQNSPRNLLRR